MTGNLEGRVAIVTGGGQGVGQGIVRALAAGGANIVIAQRRQSEGDREADHLHTHFGVEALCIATDVTRTDQVETLVDRTRSKFGRIDILVNNAGASTPLRLENHSDGDMNAAVDLNFMSAFRTMRAVFPIMKAQRHGRIINLGSLNGVNAHMFTAGYNAGKEAVRALTRTAAVEWGPHGITANVICPSASSPQARDYFDANPDMLARILEQVPAGRLGDSARDIGPVVAFLASDAGGYMTGNTLFLDGGAHVNGIHWKPVVQD